VEPFHGLDNSPPSKMDRPDSTWNSFNWSLNSGRCFLVTNNKEFLYIIISKKIKYIMIKINNIKVSDILVLLILMKRLKMFILSKESSKVVPSLVVRNFVFQIGIWYIFNFGCTIKCYQKWTV